MNEPSEMMPSADSGVADEELVCAVEKGGIVLGVTGNGDVTRELLLHGVNRMAMRVRDVLGACLTLNRKLHRANRIVESTLAENAKLAERLKNLETKYDETLKFASDQTQSLALAMHELSVAKKKLKKRKK